MFSQNYIPQTICGTGKFCLKALGIIMGLFSTEKKIGTFSVNMGHVYKTLGNLVLLRMNSVKFVIEMYNS